MKMEASNRTELLLLLNKICTIYTKNCPEQRDQIEQNAVKSLFEGLSTTNLPRINTNEHFITTSIQKQIERLNTSEDGLHFYSLLSELQKLNGIRDIPAVLQFLYAQSTANSSINRPDKFIRELRSLNYRSNIQKANQKVGVQASIEKIFSLESKSSFTSTIDTKKSPMASINSGSRNQLCLKRMDSCSNDSKKEGFSFSSKTSLPVSFETEYKIIQNLIFALQGIESPLLRLEPDGGFRIDPKIDVNQGQRQIILRIAEVGYLHNKVQEFCNQADNQLGIMYQSLVSALRDELATYYKLIAILQEQLNPDKLTLRKLLIWIVEPKQRLQWLVTISNAAKFKKGGDLISYLYGFLSHGSSPVQMLVQHILSEVCRPLLNSIANWVMDGQIEDPCAEFFIEARPEVAGDRLWHEKYRLREAMIPSFITREQAEKILATGKSIDYLREVCKESPPRISPLIKRLFEESNVESLYLGTKSSTLHAAIDTVYKDTSRKVLDILLNKYNLMQHLNAIKRYLLLGQGDFIRHLMEMLMPELSQPASQLTPHNLSAILESAIRSTNAQYEDADILTRLDVKIVQNSKQDVGWEVFSLIYHTNGPIGTIFVPCEDQYRALFHSLWNSKRMEFILAVLWKNLTTSARAFRNLAGVQEVMQQMHLLTAEMIHLVRQMQYYVLFEVLECNWDELTRKISAAGSLDDVITAHNQFLNEVRAGALLDQSAEVLSRQLRNIYSHIIQLQTYEEHVNMQAQAELDAEREREQLIESQKDGYALNARNEAMRRERRETFQRQLTTSKGYLKTLANSYQKHVRKFLLLLSEQPNMSLQLLSFRLDFNGNYKRLRKSSQSASKSQSK